MKKLLAVSYGFIAYGVFLGAFLYAVAFVGNLFSGSTLVPKTIDSGSDGDFLTSLIIDAALLSVFAVQHSVMARPAFKKWWTRIIGPTVERSTYVLVSSLALILMYWQWRPMTSTIWSTNSDAISYVIWAVCGFGWLVVFLSTWMINHFELFGLKQIYEHVKDLEPKETPFQVNFFYKLVRHPLMVGFIIAFWATPHMTVGHLIFALATTGYIVVAVMAFEEPDLKRAIGAEYEDYQKEVPMFIPFTK